MSKIAIYMKSGNVIKLDMASWSTKTTGDTLTSLKWMGTDGKPRLVHISLDDIEAFVEEKV